MEFYRRQLPHWHPVGASLFITWRLHGTLPAAARYGEVKESAGWQFTQFDRMLDRATPGPKWLSHSQIGSMVAGTIRQGGIVHGYYRLHAFVVMPNHVHVLLTPVKSTPEVTRWLKGVTSRQANRILGCIGKPFWQHESYDHWVRTEDEGQRIIRYIEFNPVCAGLAETPESWPWSSAAVEPASAGFG